MIRESLLNFLLNRKSQLPGLVIGGHLNPYLVRWYVTPKNRWFNIYLHRILRPDDDRALHDHPWWNVSYILDGSYIEVVPMDAEDPSGLTVQKYRQAGSLTFRRAKDAHRLDLHTDRSGKYRPVWSLFITGPRFREWGFWCPNGWKHWKKFVANSPGISVIGPGCGD